MITAPEPTPKLGLLCQSSCPLAVPNPDALGIGQQWKALFLGHQQGGNGFVLVPAKSPCFLPPDNPSDGTPGRGHQGHHPRREPGPGIPRHRLPRQGGWCRVQPLGGWLHPCRTVSGRDLRHRPVLEGREDKPTTSGLKAYGG